MKTIRTVLIGAGYRGMRLYQLMRFIPEFEIVAAFDPSTHPVLDNSVRFYTGSQDTYLAMLKENQPQLAVIASPWQYHIEQTLHCLQQGCHVALEVKGGFHLGEYDEVIRLSKEKGLKVFPLENTVFMQENMALFQMVRQGILGDIVAMRGGYRHDLRDMLIDEQGNLGNPNKPEGLWRSKFYLTENGDLYPTHGIAPLCLAAGINRNDHLEELTSFASRACGLNRYQKEKGGNGKLPISMGDIIITQLRSEKGILITLTHDTTLPRPRSLDFEIQGTKGIWRGEFRKIYLEGISQYEEWEDDADYIRQFNHPLWKEWGAPALKHDAHHQGMDYIMLRALANDLTGGEAYPILAEDLALWTSISPYSKLSIKEKRTICMTKPE